MPIDDELRSMGCNDHEALLRGPSSPLVSVIVRGSGAAACPVLDSIEGQSYPAIEIILAGSADGGNAARAGRRGRFPVRVAGDGAPAAGGGRTAEALEAARGEYVAVVDAGCWWLPHTVAALVAALERRPDAVAAYGGVRTAEEDGRTLEPAAALAASPGGPIPVGAALFRRRLAGLGCRPGGAGDGRGDEEFWLRAMRHGPVLHESQISAVRWSGAPCPGAATAGMTAARQAWRSELARSLRELSRAEGGAREGAEVAAALAEIGGGLAAEAERARARTGELEGLLASITGSRSWRLAAAARRPAGRPGGRASRSALPRPGGGAQGGPAGADAGAPGPGLRGAPFVSVVLPVFNACGRNAGFLREAVASVCAQSYRNLELVIVDDGSTDGTLELCRDLIRRHGEVPIRLYHKPNGGQSSARNAGVAVSRGEWLCFIDQDDVWYPDRLESVLDRMGRGVDFVYTDADSTDESGRLAVFGILRFLGAGGRHPKRRIEEILFADVFVVPGVMAVRRSMFEQVGGFDEALSGYEDDDLFLRLFESATIEYVPRSTLRWRQHGESASRSSRMVDSRVRYWRKLMTNYAGGGSDRARTRRISLRFAREMLRQANFSFRKGGVIHTENVTTAREVLRHVGPCSRAILSVFIVNGFRWRRPNLLLEKLWDRWLRLA